MINPEKLKLGDQYINNGPNGSHIGEIRTIISIDYKNSKVHFSINNESFGSYYNDFSDFSDEYFNFEIMNLKDQYIKQGNLVKTEDGDYGFVYNDEKILFKYCNLSICNIPETLSYTTPCQCNIVEVFVPNSSYAISQGVKLWDPEYYTSIWKRGEQKVEKTIAELEKELGLTPGSLRIKK